MTLYSTFHRFAAAWVRERRAAYTARVLAELPAELRKDIGWPAERGAAARGKFFAL